MALFKKANHLNTGVSALALAFLLTISLFHAAPALPKKQTTAPADGLETVTVLHQNTDALGKADLYLAQNAGRLVARDGEIIIATSAPRWDILLYSKKKNEGWLVPGAKNRDGSLSIFGSPIDLTRNKPQTLFDPMMKIDYTLASAEAKKETAKTRDPFIFQSRSDKSYSHGSIKIANNLCKLQPQLQAFLNWIYSQDHFVGVPMEMKSYFEDGSVRIFYSTQSIETKKVPSSMFAYPKNYKPASEKLLVLFSNDAQSTMEDLWGSSK